MPVIRPSSDLRNKYNEISDYCRTYNEPVFITKNGTGDLVVLSHAEYERLIGKEALHRQLDEGFEAYKNGKTRKAEDIFADLEDHFHLGGE